MVLQQLYQQGARKMAILGLPPVGYVPLQRTVAGGLARNCDRLASMRRSCFNTKLKEEIERLQKGLQCQRIGYVESTTVYVSTRGCCGTGDFKVSLLCNRLTATMCPDDRKCLLRQLRPY
ncbi:hypothetical protein EJB05_43719, partial [Eragrostis curvula]